MAVLVFFPSVRHPHPLESVGSCPVALLLDAVTLLPELEPYNPYIVERLER